MTNKLPVVGKRYKTKGRGLWWHKESEVCGVYNGKVWIDMCYSDNNNKIMSLEQFYGSHEELPEDKAETKPEAQSHVSELSPEVKEAMKKLSEKFQWYGFARQWSEEKVCLAGIFDQANLLLNALDKQFNYNGYFEDLPPSKEAIERSKQEEVVDNKIKGEGQIVTPLEESIWKPVSELPDKNVEVILRKEDGSLYYSYLSGKYPYRAYINPQTKCLFSWGDFKEVCTLTDFINDYEKLKERVNKLERK